MTDTAARVAVRWLFVGAGNMASALVEGLLAGGVSHERLALVDTDAAARERAARTFGCAVHATTDEALDALATHPSNASRIGIVLAVKPDVVVPVCRTLSAHAAWRASDATRPFVVSIAAGVRIETLAGALDAGDTHAIAIVRAMPNTPSLIGRGAAGLHANDACDASVRGAARALFEGVGIAVDLSDESLIDAVTAVSGSGPAYAFALVEHMAAAGAALGLPPQTAVRLAAATVGGAGSMAATSDDSPATLRQRVTSKGGTTAAALASFEADDFRATVERAVRAAHARAVELGAPAAEDG